ncbi:hypothetical protein [Cryobacterium aureum]|uniref:hypothetical protein n=1 Tax=Cryobacterium aureum TaxID=995037 RepID=UPI00196A7E3D|nr:hypothetical protein [Cryobacterium aureum]
MRTALSLAPESRFVLRSATRFYIHIEDPEQANFILQRSERLRSDPWLLAAELSTSQLAFGKFNNERAARELLISDNLSPHSLSELASALATNEIRSGRDSRAKKLFAIALTAPTENAVAQAASVAEHGDIQIAPELLTIERGFEARAINNSRSGAWDLAAKEGQDWQFDQPFALEPALFTSYAAAIGTANFQLAYDVAVNGLRTHPYDAMLHNNAAFALGNLDRPAEAREHLTFAHDTDDDEDSYVHRATLGLILFREGNPTGGREKYLSAIEALIATKKEMAAVATVLWAIEESLVQSDVAKESKGLAGEAVRRFPSPEGTAVLARLNRLDGVDLRAFPVSVK